MSVRAEQEFVEEIKRRYMGKWIGVMGRRVVAVLDSHEELIEELKRRGLDNVYVFYSPSPRKRSTSFFSWCDDENV